MSKQSIQLCFTANWNVRLIVNLNFPRTRSSYTCTNRTFQYLQNVCRMSQISQGISILHQKKIDRLIFVMLVIQTIFTTWYA